METFPAETEKTCFFCSSFPGCPVFLEMSRALEVFRDSEKLMKALYYALAEVCNLFNKYKEDPDVKSRAAESGALRKIAEAAEEDKVIILGKTNENGTGSKIVSAYLQGIYDSPEEAQVFTEGMNVISLKKLVSDRYPKE